MKNFLKIIISTLLFLIFTQSVFSQKYKDLDVLTAGTRQEIIEFLAEDENNCVSATNSVIESYNHVLGNKLVIVLEPRIVTVVTKEYDFDSLYNIMLDAFYQNNYKEIFYVDYLNIKPLTYKLTRQTP